MPRFFLILLLCFVLTSPASAQSPIPIHEVVSVDLIVAGLEEKLETLEELLADPEKYDDNEEQIIRGGGVLACLSQALIEHKENKDNKIAAPALRDAGIAMQDYVGHEEASELLKTAQAAMRGTSEGEHEKEHAWDELIGMYEMMEEMNDRNGGLSRSLRRPRGKVSEQLNASTNAVLGIAMWKDHSYVEGEEQAAEWDGLSKDYLKAMTNLVSAIAEKDRDKVAEFYKLGNRSCDKCHESFRGE